MLRIFKRVPGIKPAGRAVTVYGDDVFLVSYPRSGNIWVRFLLANLLDCETPASFATTWQIMPDIYKKTNRQLAKLPRPRFIKSHEPFDSRYNKVVYIVRDPRDVLISYYHFHRKFQLIDDGHPIERYGDDFLVGRLPYGSWGEHIGGWIDARKGDDDFLMVRYEDLLSYGPETVRKICSFVGISANQSAIDRALRLSSAERMRALEEKEQSLWSSRGVRTDIKHVRQARAGTWREELPKDLAEAVASKWGDLMTSLGYL